MPTSRGAARGFTMVWCLIAVAVMGIYLAKVGDVWTQRAQREREIELRHVGQQIREGIRRYVENGDGHYPRSLADLVEDSRAGQTRRWLRKAWRDPMTGEDWQYIASPDGGFLGVYSASTKQPLQRQGFPEHEHHLARAQSYADWRFAHWPGQIAPAAITPP